MSRPPTDAARYGVEWCIRKSRSTIMIKERTALVSILLDRHQELQSEWLSEVRGLGSEKDRRISDAELKTQTSEFLKLLGKAVQQNNTSDIQRPEWTPVRSFLEEISRSRVLQGFESEQTAMFIFSLKRPLFTHLREVAGNNADALAHETLEATELLDRLGLYTMKTYEKSREAVINRQQEELLELSTPVIKLWDGVLALPMIGTLDSARTQIVMESLLQRIVATGSEIAILDITGVPTVDTVVAQHLLKTVTAIRLMGADCIISGIRPQIAQTIVHLGVDLHGVITKATLADALSLAMKRLGLSVRRGNGPAASTSEPEGASTNGATTGPRAGLGVKRPALEV
jgi:rsbT co-antagonist protein RsbR